MITVDGRAVELLDAAGAAAAATLPVGEPLTVAPTTIDELTLVGAVVVAFAGSTSGELALLVDAELTDAMKGATIGEVDLALALAPTLEAVAAAIGPVVLGEAQALDPRLALARITSHADVATIALRTSTDIRAALVLGVDVAVENDVIPQLMTSGGPALDRLDLLRGVEMAASVELGRSKMTVNDLLSLRNGSVIELDRAAGESADLFVNGRLIARGEVVVVDENYALRITQIATEDGR
jgi:flagellar motor switch protein FliN/FliY